MAQKFSWADFFFFEGSYNQHLQGKTVEAFIVCDKMVVTKMKFEIQVKKSWFCVSPDLVHKFNENYRFRNKITSLITYNILYIFP